MLTSSVPFRWGRCRCRRFSSSTPLLDFGELPLLSVAGPPAALVTRGKLPTAAAAARGAERRRTPSDSVDIIAAVPRISEFYGIVIEMYNVDHPPPHFHARYGDDSAKIDIVTGGIVAGSLPSRALRLVREWGDQHRDELEANWERALRHERPRPIDPLP